MSERLKLAFESEVRRHPSFGRLPSLSSRFRDTCRRVYTDAHLSLSGSQFPIECIHGPADGGKASRDTVPRALGPSGRVAPKARSSSRGESNHGRPVRSAAHLISRLAD